MTETERTAQESEEPPTRQVPRLLAYPLLLVIPVLCIFWGIKLGSKGVWEDLMLTSQNGTPVENWTLSLIATSIAVFMYSSWAYGNRTFRARPVSFVVVLTYIGAIFVFGVWGLYAAMIPSALCLWIWLRHWRRLAKVRPSAEDL